MKSLHNAKETPGATSWQPLEFPKAETNAPVAKPEEIMAIFQSDTPLPETAPGASRHIKPAATAQNWLPGELPPYVPTVQAFIPKPVDFPRTGPHAESRKTPDTAVAQAMREKVNQMLEEAHNTRAEALRILEDAKQQAHEILVNAQKEAENRMMQGYDHGRSQAHAEYITLLETTREMVSQTGNWRAEMLAQSEPVVIEMLKEIAATLFGADMVLDRKVVQEVCARALMKARTMGALRIFVNPRDAAQLDADWRDFQVSVSGQRIQIVPTDSITPGGCFIEGDNGAVDARLETRVGAVMKVFDAQPEE